MKLALSASALAALLTMFGAHAVGYSPPSVADAPQPESDFTPDHPLALARGICEGLDRTWDRAHGDCWPVPNLGVKTVAKPKRGRR